MKTQNFDFRIYNTEEKKYIDRNGYVQKYNVDNYFVVLVKDSFQILKIRDMTKEMNIDSKNYWMAEYSTIKDVTNICEIELWTGLYDKNGKKIYEGDVIKYVYIFKHELLDKGMIKKLPKKVSIGYIGIDNFLGFRILKNKELQCFMKDIADIEIIGNIHENKELLNARL